MYRRQLEETFCWKISSELKIFQYRMLRKSKEEIYAYAYQIDCMITIYEILMELSTKLESFQLEQCICKNGLLDYLYRVWMDVPDLRNQELENILCCAIQRISADVA